MANQTAINKGANAKLKKIYADKGITTCELRLEGCTNNWALGFHHRHRRVDYRSWTEGLLSFNQTILCCVSCHEKVQYDKDLSDHYFGKLRGPEE